MTRHGTEDARRQFTQDLTLPLAVVVGVTAVASGVSAVVGFHGLVVPYAAAVVACALVWLGRRLAGPRLLALSGGAFGIYLLHPLVASVYHRLVPDSDRHVSIAVVFVLSCILVAIARRTPLRRVV